MKNAVEWADSIGKMMVWGGAGFPNNVDDGALFDPATNTWDAVSSVDAPSARVWHTIVWTGSEFIVWGRCKYRLGFYRVQRWCSL